MNMRFIILLIFALFARPAFAQLPGAPLNVPAKLVAETQQPAPGGMVTLAFVMTPKPTWHGYWENPGDAGVGMQLDWDLPDGVTAGNLRYPVPDILIIAGLMNHVYEKPYTLLVDLKIDENVPPGMKLPVKVRADWLACTDSICVPEGDDLAIDLTIGDGKIQAENRAKFDGYRAALPVPIDAPGTYAVRGDMIEIAIPFPADAKVVRPYFFPLTQNYFAYAAPQYARRAGNFLIMTAAIRGDAPNDGVISGLLRIGDGDGILVMAMPGEIPAGGTSISVLGQGDDRPDMVHVNIWLTLAAAILGGMLLNLMPCVFPILGLKALSIAKLGADARAAKGDALAYMAGVIISCLILGGVMLALRAGGEQVGWAFQLQEPRIVFLLTLLMVAVTMNLAGGFELPTPNFGFVTGGVTGGGNLGAFGTGILAAIVATPCTGPFMAAALGAALLLPTFVALGLFAGLGFGLALPYLAIAFVPAFRGLLPKSGPWLEHFRKWMAVPMALTVIALSWLLWRLSGLSGLIMGVGVAILVAMLLYFYGRAQMRGRGRGVLVFIAVLVIALSAIFALPRDPVVVAPDRGDDIVQVQPYSRQILADMRAQNIPVFVYFTADWCVTCKVNETAALQRTATANAFKMAGVKVLEGDFTRRNPEYARVLAEYGRSGVPLYLYFAPGKDAQILPQILTPQILIDLTK